MIHYFTGNIFESNAEALVNTVNLVGVMGKGIALQFKKRLPKNFIAYRRACKEGKIAVGKLFVNEEDSYYGLKTIINFSTKTDWRQPSEYEYIDKGLDDLVRVINNNGINSIAIPPLGSGNGGLDWPKVKEMIADKLSGLEIDIYVFEPTKANFESKQFKEAKLNEARALLLYVLFDLERNGEYVSEFSSEKVCYFLQKFGAKNIFKLNFPFVYYGPYCGKLKLILNYLQGSYILGYRGLDSDPFEILFLVLETFEEIKSVVENNPRLMEIATKTMNFLDSFYSDSALELLSSVDYILNKFGKNITNVEICELWQKMSNRETKLLSDPKYLEIARDHILHYLSTM